MLLYNTLSGHRENLNPESKKELKLFVCGPTVYDDAHIGHARTYLVFDLLARHLRSAGQKIFYLQNITNIDDKIIARAKEENKKPLSLANFFEKRYEEDMRALGIKSVNKYARATSFIRPILNQVKTLIEKGYAYKISGDGYYFDVSKFPEYGKLSRRTALQAEDAVSRIDEGLNKRNRADFALWKFQKEESEPAWKSELGKGRPGWHIEDTAISEKFFGPQYDLHGGAVDLKFPHHEAEIAQQEAASGKKPFVRIWLHTGFLLVENQKMSKSLKNFITIREFLEKYPAIILRWIVFSHHYRSPINFSWAVADQAAQSLSSVVDFIAKLEAGKKRKGGSFVGVKEIIEKNSLEFKKALEDDFNTPLAQSKLFDFVNEINPKIWDLNGKEATMAKKYVADALKIFGFDLKTPKIPSTVKKLAAKRELFRNNKQFIQADDLRNQIGLLGYTLEDTPTGPWLKQKQNFRPKT